MSSKLTQQQLADLHQVCDALFEFLEWIYQLTLSDNARAPLRSEIETGWPNPDQSVGQFLVYLRQLHQTIFAQPAAEWKRYRPRAHDIFKQLFSANDPTARGSVVWAIQQQLERARPGCTGVAPTPPAPAANWPMPPSAAAPPVPATAPTVPTSTPPQGAAAPPVLDPNAALSSVPDVLDYQKQLKAREQRLVLEQQLSDLEHRLTMGVIQSIGR